MKIRPNEVRELAARVLRRPAKDIRKVVQEGTVVVINFRDTMTFDPAELRQARSVIAAKLGGGLTVSFV